MIVPKEKIMFRKCNHDLNSQKGKDMQKNNLKYQALKKDIAKQGMVNPLLCIKEDEMYKICVGMRRFIAGEELGMTEFNVKVLPNDGIHLLKKEIKKQTPTEVK
jgi:ParB-like chromosome segregation protein Spo0J|tara:strand:+ start:18 stop:329 length:312 start_codon:yes stop_codon:yes gene_type:complete